MKQIVKKLWEHKFKTLAVILLFYGSLKVWRIYNTWIRPFLDIAKSIKGDNKSQSEP